MGINILQIIGLAAVNAMNPCALGVLILVLISILLANENKRYKVLLGGLYFSLAVFIGYFIYGVVIIKIFKSFVEFATVVSPYIKSVLALVAIVIGIFQIKDYLNYRPGGFATEMPLRFRPIMKESVKKITSPSGAFITGVFVTLFLLPCTIAPYLIVTGNLASLEFIKTIPYLLLYNLIFVSPMIVITLLVYLGLSSTEKLHDWRERNIKKIHLIAGIIMIVLGILMITGII